ncbi:hypothetical protein BJ085DRAFT_27353 [Dimargaris cristalligena]|uniref:Uncharacterized protein n=1 Tax=Dimargaris cristalligena TaxID=215637 RepID=A0A4P9ZRM7_9FUNG|nr:hypothetical protein BJ085DRAFT_27353 [Dimargaris cristalligena]|eukprot:RKP36196.1 hypothetical protein BJ085DRAFT_27353 [Dimargaris cristalligena]
MRIPFSIGLVVVGISDLIPLTLCLGVPCTDCPSKETSASDAQLPIWKQLPPEITEIVISQTDPLTQFYLLKNDMPLNPMRRQFLSQIFKKTRAAYSDQSLWDHLSAVWLALASKEILDSTLHIADDISRRRYQEEQVITPANEAEYCRSWGDFEQFVLANRHLPIINHNTRYPLLLGPLEVASEFPRQFPLVAGLQGSTLIQLWELREAARSKTSQSIESNPALPNPDPTPALAPPSLQANLTFPEGYLDMLPIAHHLPIREVLPDFITRAIYVTLWYWLQDGRLQDIYEFFTGPSSAEPYVYQVPVRQDMIPTWGRFVMTLALLKGPSEARTEFIRTLGRLLERHDVRAAVPPAHQFDRGHGLHVQCLHFWGFRSAAEYMDTIWDYTQTTTATINSPTVARSPLRSAHKCYGHILNHHALAWDTQGRLVQWVPKSQLLDGSEGTTTTTTTPSSSHSSLSTQSPARATSLAVTNTPNEYYESDLAYRVLIQCPSVQNGRV